MSEEEKKAIDDLFALTHINGYIDLYTQKEAKIHTLDLSKWQNGVKVLLNLLEKQQKEIEEKTTIIMAGAEKVKQLEKEIQRLEKDNDTLSELVIVNEDKVIKELDLISKDKIREKIKELEEQIEEILEDK